MKRQEEGILPPSIDQQSALERVAEAVTRSEHQSLKLVGENEEAGFQVAVNADNEYEVFDAAGNLIPNLRPALRADDTASPARLVQRLAHISKYRAVLLIENPNSHSSLTGKILLELIKVPPDFGLEENATLPPPDADSQPTLTVGERAVLRVRNNSDLSLKISLLDLQPDWGISQVTSYGHEFELLGAGEENTLDILLQIDLPAGYQEGTEVLKVFATTQSTNFQWLEHPPLDQPQALMRGSSTGASSPLEEFISALIEHTKLPDFSLLAASSLDWTTSQIEIRIEPQKPPTEQIKELEAQAQKLFQEAQYEKAVEAAMRARDLIRQHLGEQTSEFAANLNLLATLYKQTGRYSAAEPLYQQALAIHRGLFKVAHPDYAESLVNLAELYRETGKYKEAEPHYRQSLDIYQELAAHGKNRSDYAAALNNLALLYAARGDYAAAEPLLNRSRDLVRDVTGEEHVDYAAVLGNLAELYRLISRYDEAEALYKRSLEIVRKAKGEHSPALASKLNNLGLLYKTIGDYDAAEPLFLQAQSILRASHQSQHPNFAQLINNLAELYQATGRYQDAENLYYQALELKRKALGSNHQSCGETQSNLATLYSDMGQYEEADRHYRVTTSILKVALGEDHPEYALTLRNLARLKHLTGELEEAERLYRQALSIQTKVLSPEHLEVARTDSSLAKLYLECGKFDEAEEFYSRALDIRRKVLGTDNPEVAVSLCALARLRRLTGNFADAETLYRKAYNIQRIALGEVHPAFVQTLNNLALVLAARGREVEAMELAQRAQLIEDSMVELIFSVGSERQRKTYLKAIEENFQMFLSLVCCYFKDSAAAIRESFDLVLRRKAITVESLAAERELALMQRYPELSEQLKELISLRAQIAQKILQAPAGLFAQQKLLDDWNKQKEQLEGELAAEIPEIKLARQLRTVDRRSVAQALPYDSSLVEFVRLNFYDFTAVQSQGAARWQPARYLAFVVPAGIPDKVQMIDLGEAETIDRMVRAFRQTLMPASSSGTIVVVPKEDPRAVMADAEGLRAKVFDPLLPALGDNKFLVLAPDGDLIKLPFAALNANGGHLIDHFNFSYLHTGRDVLRFAILPTGSATETLVIADPDYDLAAATRKKVSRVRPPEGLTPFVRLPGTRIEGERIASILEVRPWIGDKALETSLKAFRSPRILHMAAHGYFLTDRKQNPNQDSLDFEIVGGPGVDELARLHSRNGGEQTLRRSGIALAGANTTVRGGDLPSAAEDGLLTAEEILSLDLSGTELVTLTACQTGDGASSANESIVCLQRAFLMAGAKTLVMNLWQVPDEQTAFLMQEFYRRIAEGKSQARALEQAQQAIRREFPAPYFWGAFVCLGDVAPLPVQKKEFVKAPELYVAGAPIKSDKLFVGRTDILRIIQDNLAPSAGQNILLLRGQRRTGKTSLLYRLKELLQADQQSNYIPAYVDLQGLTDCHNDSEFFYNFALFMSFELEEVGITAPDLDAKDFEKTPAIAFELKFLRPLTRSLGNRRILLMIDEFDLIKHLIDSGKLGGHVLDSFRHLMQHTRVLFLIAGTYKLIELTGDYYSVFFNLTVPIIIGKLPENDTRELITEPVKPWYEIESSAVDEIVRIAGRHPYFTQLVCKKLHEVRNESGLNLMTLTYVEEAIKRALESGEENIGYPWTETDCTTDERLLLAVMAQEDHPTKHVQLETVTRLLETEKIVTPLGAMIKRLQERGILQLDNNGNLTFVVPLFQRWLVEKGYASLAAARKYNDEHSTPKTNGG